MTIQERIDSAAEAVRARTGATPELGLILGSGLGDFCDRLENQTVIPFSDLPGFPLPTVEGHEGALVLGTCRGRAVAALRGRVHYYEGYAQQEITIPVRVMAKLGVRTLVLTNAAGGVNLNFQPGNLMLISDHINHAGLQVMGVSCITNMAAGILPQPLSHAEVVETAARVKQDFTCLLELMVDIG